MRVLVIEDDQEMGEAVDTDAGKSINALMCERNPDLFWAGGPKHGHCYDASGEIVHRPWDNYGEKP